MHGSVGCASLADLVVRGDRFARRARAYALPSPADVVCFRPDTVFQLVPGAYNRIALSVNPKTVGHRYTYIFSDYSHYYLILLLHDIRAAYSNKNACIYRT